MNMDTLKISLIGHARRELEDNVANLTIQMSNMLCKFGGFLTTEEKACYVDCLRAQSELLKACKRRMVPVEAAKKTA